MFNPRLRGVYGFEVDAGDLADAEDEDEASLASDQLTKNVDN
jgi:hypothetical protein